MQKSLIEKALLLSARHPHDFTIQYPIRREYFRDNFSVAVPSNQPQSFDVASQLKTLSAAGSSIGLYVHVPFCASKCYYCNFAVDTRKSPAIHERYVSLLERELSYLNSIMMSGDADLTSRQNTVLSGIDIGGGTPTLLCIPLLKRVLSALVPFHSRCLPSSSPLSIETTPRIAATEPEKLTMMKELGVNRVSVGIQSTNAETLQRVNRQNQIELAESAIKNIRAADIDRLSVDIIFGLPGQTVEQWHEDLAFVAASGVDTITTYDCLYRGKGRSLSRTHKDWPKPDRYGELYNYAYDYLHKHGYHAPYGSVNFSKHAGETGVSAYFESRLLRGDPYIGVGNYASSMLGRYWTFAPYMVDEWAELVENENQHFPMKYVYDLPEAERMAKYLLLSLSFGVIHPQHFASAFDGSSFEQLYAASLEQAVQRGWMYRSEDGSWKIVDGQFASMPQIRSLFYSAGAIEWFGKLAASA
jgi:oxygen-independent coproporphyrinogen-3 oxidase